MSREETGGRQASLLSTTIEKSTAKEGRWGAGLKEGVGEKSPRRISATPITANDGESKVKIRGGTVSPKPVKSLSKNTLRGMGKGGDGARKKKNL